MGREQSRRTNNWPSKSYIMFVRQCRVFVSESVAIFFTLQLIGRPSALLPVPTGQEALLSWPPGVWHCVLWLLSWAHVLRAGGWSCNGQAGGGSSPPPKWVRPDSTVLTYSLQLAVLIHNPAPSHSLPLSLHVSRPVLISFFVPLWARTPTQLQLYA